VLEPVVVDDGHGPPRHVAAQLLPAADLARAPLVARGLALQRRVRAAAGAAAAAADAAAGEAQQRRRRDKNIIADRNFLDCKFVENALIYALIASAK
jgi:hypothetical protein